MPRRFPRDRADAFATTLEIGLDVGICHACLSFVSFALDRGDPAEIARETRRVTRDLWEEGLAEVALAAARRACDLGIPDAHAALGDLERNAGKSATAHALVRRLAADLSRRTRTEMRLEALTRDRLTLAPPEMN